jgi:hypothetical protein
VEVDGVLPGDHLLLPRRSSLPLRHLSSPLLRVRVGDSAVWCSAAAREENPTGDGVAFYMRCTQNDVATWAGWCSPFMCLLLGPRGPGERLWRVGCMCLKWEKVNFTSLNYLQS